VYFDLKGPVEQLRSAYASSTPATVHAHRAESPPRSSQTTQLLPVHSSAQGGNRGDGGARQPDQGRSAKGVECFNIAFGFDRRTALESTISAVTFHAASSGHGVVRDQGVHRGATASGSLNPGCGGWSIGERYLRHGAGSRDSDPSCTCPFTADNRGRPSRTGGERLDPHERRARDESAWERVTATGSSTPRPCGGRTRTRC